MGALEEVEGMIATMVNWSFLSSVKRGRQLEQGSQLESAREILGHGENFQKALKMSASESELETYKGHPTKPDCMYDMDTEKSYGKWKFLFPKNEETEETEETISEEPSAQAAPKLVYRGRRARKIEEEKAKKEDSKKREEKVLHYEQKIANLEQLYKEQIEQISEVANQMADRAEQQVADAKQQVAVALEDVQVLKEEVRMLNEENGESFKRK